MNYPSPLFSYKPRQQVVEQDIPEDREGQKRLDPKLPIKQLLGQMFPTIYFEAQGVLYQLQPSDQQLKRQQLKGLKQSLNNQLYLRQSKTQGICPIRLQVHNQLFDQIIRQCTINCSERGLLLMRIRDNIKMTFSAYETLYQGSIVFSNRKGYASQIGLPQLHSRIKQLKKNKIDLQNRKSHLQNQLDSTQRSFREQRALQDKKRNDQVSFLRRQSQYLQQYLHNM